MTIKDILPQGTAIKLNEYSPLTLAFIGDSIYELFIRTMIAGSKNTSPGKLHKEAVNYVKAEAQAKAAKAISTVLTEEEKDILKRGRNTKSATVPKNASVLDYRLATGFEALLGYLFLKGDEKRMTEICSLAVAANRNTYKPDTGQTIAEDCNFEKNP